VLASHLQSDQAHLVCVLVLIATISEHQFIYQTESAISDQLRSLRAGRNVSYRKEGRQVFLPLARSLLTGAQGVREHLAE
jgi:hypothetical protein